MIRLRAAKAAIVMVMSRRGSARSGRELRKDDRVFTTTGPDRVSSGGVAVGPVTCWSLGVGAPLADFGGALLGGGRAGGMAKRS